MGALKWRRARRARWARGRSRGWPCRLRVLRTRSWGAGGTSRIRFARQDDRMQIFVTTSSPLLPIELSAVRVPTLLYTSPAADSFEHGAAHEVHSSSRWARRQGPRSGHANGASPAETIDRYCSRIRRTCCSYVHSRIPLLGADAARRSADPSPCPNILRQRHRIFLRCLVPRLPAATPPAGHPTPPLCTCPLHKGRRHALNRHLPHILGRYPNPNPDPNLRRSWV